jgi:hypothetical protein
MILDTNTNTAHWKKVGTKSEIHVEPTGHTSLNICEFNPQGWKDPRDHMAPEAYAQLPEPYKPKDSVTELTASSPPYFLPICHDELWAELRNSFNGTLSCVDHDFPVQGREDVRCVQIGSGDPSAFPFLPEFGNLTNIGVELWNVGPTDQEQILNIQDFVKEGVDTLWPQEADAFWWPSDVNSALVWIVYKPSHAYNDATMTDDDDKGLGTGKESQYPVVHHSSAKAVSAQEWNKKREQWRDSFDVWALAQHGWPTRTT